jgi:hypothetical protein
MSYAIIIVYVYILGVVTGFAMSAAIQAHKRTKRLRKIAAELEGQL